MNVEIKWYDDRKTAVLMTITAFIADWAEFDAGADQALELANSVSHEVIVIVNPQGIPMPRKGAPLPHLRRALVRMTPNVKFIVGITGGLGIFEKSIVDIVATISFRNRLKVVNSPEEAYALIP
jgi:hypothetical protein